MTHDEMLRAARTACLSSAFDAAGPALFPEAPSGNHSAENFASVLIAAAFQNSAQLQHPFTRGLAQGRWSRAQMAEWVRQEYAGTIYSIRRHALYAAACQDCDSLRAVLGYVKGEADADPVGGSYFSLPQLWVKLGIALGLTRAEIVSSQPAPALRAWNEQALAIANASRELPVSLLVDALLNPVFHRLWGEALERSLALPRDVLDYFWAAAGDRWGEDAGRPLLESWCGSPAAQRSVWERYRREVQTLREYDRLTIIQQVIEPASHSRAEYAGQ